MGLRPGKQGAIVPDHQNSDSTQFGGALQCYYTSPTMMVYLLQYSSAEAMKAVIKNRLAHLGSFFWESSQKSFW